MRNDEKCCKCGEEIFEMKKVAIPTKKVAGTQIAIGDGGKDEDSPLNVAKAEMGRQIGQVGTEIIRRNLNIQPTLEIRPGYRFNVMVNKDIILSPYKSY